MWLLVWIILTGLSTPTEVCNSTIFGMPGDELAGKKARHLGRAVNDTDVGIAHRYLPLGSTVVVELGNRAVVATVIDRGPYGRIRPRSAPCPKALGGRRLKDGRCWVNGAYEYRECQAAGKHPIKDKSCYYPGSYWNGCVDTTPALAASLGHDGWERVKLYRWPLNLHKLKRWIRRNRRRNNS